MIRGDGGIRIGPLLLCALAAWGPCAVAATAQDGLVLAEEGGTTCTIVLRPDAHPAERTAADELRRHFEQVTGATLPIAEAAPAEGHRIFVRIGARPGDILADVPSEPLAGEELLMQRVGGDLVLAGGGPRGVLYAVYRFLQDQLGCRWYAVGYGRNPACTVIPRRPTLILGDLHQRRRPAFSYRQIHCMGHSGNEKLAVRFALNGAVGRGERGEAYGGDLLIRGIHNCLDLLRINMGIDGAEDTPDWMFAERPELFAWIDGARRKTQVCATHPDLPAIYAPLLRAQAERYGAARIGLTQMDGGGACRCDRCLAANERAGGPDVYAGSWLPLVNRTAALVPDLDVWTFAYLWTRKPPRDLRPRQNVHVWYCLTAFEHQLSTDGDAVYAELAEWGRLAPGRVFVWTYDFINNQVEFGYQPSLFVAGRRLRRLHGLGVGGVFIQAGESWSTAAPFAELQYYVLSQLLWDPCQDADQLIDAFLEAYYRSAAPWIRACRQLHHALYLVQDPAENRDLRAGQSGVCRAFGDAGLARLERLLDAAESAADDDVVRMRVRVLRLPIWHYRLMMAGRPEWMAGTYREKNRSRRWYADAGEIERTVTRLTATDEHLATIRSYVRTLAWADVRGFRESPVADWRDALRRALRQRGVVVE